MLLSFAQRLYQQIEKSADPNLIQSLLAKHRGNISSKGTKSCINELQELFSQFVTQRAQTELYDGVSQVRRGGAANTQGFILGELKLRIDY